MVLPVIPDNCLERFDNLCEALKLNNVIPYVGAGMSVPSGFCMWGKALERLHTRSTLPKTRFDELMAALDFELAALEISEKMPQQSFDECFQGLFPDRNDHPVSGAIRYMIAPWLDNYKEEILSYFDLNDKN